LPPTLPLLRDIWPLWRQLVRRTFLPGLEEKKKKKIQTSPGGLHPAHSAKSMLLAPLPSAQHGGTYAAFPARACLRLHVCYRARSSSVPLVLLPAR
jgi:hypothetical protein